MLPTQVSLSSISMSNKETSLPEDANERNQYPMADGLLWYFPNALAEVSKISKLGNDQHNPGEEMHWSRGKSTDHANKIIRHLVDAGRDTEESIVHAANMAWRALALLQEKIERVRSLPLPKNARPTVDVNQYVEETTSVNN